MRLMICDDSALFRQGLTLLLHQVGADVIAQCRDADELMTQLSTTAVDAVILDIRMPPTFTDEGLAAAERIRREYPNTGVLVLSTYAETAYAMRLVQSGPGVGYLLKDRVDDAVAVLDAVDRVAAGQLVIDPDIVGRLLGRRREQDLLARLTDRERDVLALVAEGRTNAATARHLHLAEKTVETHIATVMNKLGIAQTPDNNRRVLAVLTWMRANP